MGADSLVTNRCLQLCFGRYYTATFLMAVSYFIQPLYLIYLTISLLWNFPVYGQDFAENNDAMKIAHLLFHSLRINFQKANLCVKGQMKNVMISTMYCQSAF